MSDSFQFELFQLVLLKRSAEQKTVKLLWLTYLSSGQCQLRQEL